MKKGLILVVVFLLLFSCVKENRPSYKENDLFGEFDTQQGFVIMQLPPILFKIILNSAKIEEAYQKELFEKIDIIKVLFFEENDKSEKTEYIKDILLGKISGTNYKLLTQIIEEENHITIYCKDENQVIEEIVFLIVSDKELFCIDCVGQFEKEDALKLYKSIDTQSIKTTKK